MAQTVPAQATITAPDAAVTTPVAAQGMATPAPEMQSFLDKLAELGAQPLHTLTVDQARAQPTPADAVAAVMADQGYDGVTHKFFGKGAVVPQAVEAMDFAVAQLRGALEG